MRPSVIASPPVHPISSSSSGTGSVRTTALPKLVWRPPSGQLVPQTFRASTISRARMLPEGVSSVPGATRVTGVRSKRRTPSAMAARRSASTSLAGWTVAPSRKKTPMRNRGESVNRRTSASSSARASSSTPSSVAARTERSTAESSAGVAATFSSPASRNQTSSPRASAKARTAGMIRLDACASWSAPPSPSTARSVASDDQ